jgi:hypothetical protein
LIEDFSEQGVENIYTYQAVNDRRIEKIQEGVLFTKYGWDDQIKDNEMSEAGT